MQILKYVVVFVCGACLPVGAVLLFLRRLSHDQDGLFT